MESSWGLRILYGAGGSLFGAVAAIGVAVWAELMDWTVVGLAAAGGFVLGFLGGRTALKWIMDIIRWS